MKRIILIALSIILTLAIVTVSFSSCGIISKVKNAVVYPDTYSITYEITTAEGLIHTVTKTVDEKGNIYFKSIDSESSISIQTERILSIRRMQMASFR
jgi:hypothetical protein